MNISKRALNTQASPIRKLIPFANEAKARGKTVLHLNIGQPDIVTPPEAMEAVRSFDQAVLAYSPSDGFQPLKKKIVHYLSLYGLDLDISHINVTTGGSEAVLFALAAVCDPGDNVVIAEPFYANYKSFSAMLGIGITPVTTHVTKNFHLPSKAELENKINPRTKALLICNPGNPTGTVYTQDEIEMLADIVDEHDLFLLSDEVYREFLYDGVKFVSPLSIREIDQRVIITDSISKRYSSCGARTGFLASRNAEVMNAVLKFSMARLSPPTIGQKIAERAFSLDFSYFKEMVKEYENRRNVLIEELDKIDSIVYARPEGAFYMIVNLQGTDGEGYARFLLEEFDIAGETVMVAPASGFYATEGLGMDEVRIAFVLNREKTKRAARILREGLASYREKVSKKAG
jgi:aspartate aminotransferase